MNKYCIKLWILSVLFLLARRANCNKKYGVNTFKKQTIPELAPPDNNLHIYGLPVGQGDSWIIQCPLPGGELAILDMGSSDITAKGFWNDAEIRNFLRKSYHLITNIIITHNHDDHFNILPKVLIGTNETKSISNIYISCTESDLPKEVSQWIEEINGWKYVRLFNGGFACGPNNFSCGTIDLCPKSVKTPSMDVNYVRNFPSKRTFIEAKVLSANLGQQCKTKAKTNKNTDSVVMSLRADRVKILMNGDFEDFTSSPSENGPQKRLIDFYGKELITDVYHVSHHGAELLANKHIMLYATKPQAVMVSANPFYSHRHPRCSIFDHLIGETKFLCKPRSCNRKYCCQKHNESFSSDSIDATLQETYTCGEEKEHLRTVTDNEYAIYSTVPSNETLNLIHFYTDGIEWGFENNFAPWINVTEKEEHH